MVEWDLILKYKKDIKEIATKLCVRYDSSQVDDAISYTYLILKDVLDVSKARGAEREYVRGAIWNIVKRYMRDQRRGDHISLTSLVQDGIQIDEDYNLSANPLEKDFPDDQEGY